MFVSRLPLLVIWVTAAHFIFINCKDSAKEDIEKKAPPNEAFVDVDEFTKNAPDSVASGNLSGKIEEKSWSLRSGAVSLLIDTERYSGIIAGTKGEKQKIVCDSKGNANFRLPGRFNGEGLIEVNLPAKVGSFKSTNSDDKYSIKIYGKDPATSWEVKINKISKAELSGSIKAVFGKEKDNQVIEGTFTIEICSEK